MHFLEFYVSGIICYALFFGLAFTLHNYLSFIHVVAYHNNLFFFDTTQFFHSPLGGHLECFQFLAIIHKASLNIHVQIFVWTYASFSLGWIPRRGMARSYCNYNFKILKNWNGFTELYHFTPPLTVYETYSSSTSLKELGMVSLLNFRYSSEYVAVSHGCNLYFPNDEWWASLHVLICHPNIFL